MGWFGQRGLVLESRGRAAADRQGPGSGGNAIEIKYRGRLQCLLTPSLITLQAVKARNRNRDRNRNRNGKQARVHCMLQGGRHRSSPRQARPVATPHHTGHHAMPCHATRRDLVTRPVWPFIVHVSHFNQPSVPKQAEQESSKGVARERSIGMGEMGKTKARLIINAGNHQHGIDPQPKVGRHGACPQCRPLVEDWGPLGWP